MSFEWVTLGDITKIKTGKLDANAHNINGLYPFFTCAKEPLKIDKFSYDCECVLVAGNGDLNVKYYSGKFDAYQRTYIIESISKQKADMRYIYYFLDSYLETLRQQSIGGIIKYIKLANLTEIQVPLPSLTEQKHIVAILDKAQALIQQRELSITQLDELLKATFIKMFGDPVTNPMGWEIHKFEKLGKLDRGVSKHRPRGAPELLGGIHPLIQTGDVANSNGYIRNFTSTYSDLGLAQSKKWQKGTLCITIAANIANTGILTFDACFPDSVVGFIPNENSNVEFVQGLFMFFRKILDEQAPQSAQKNINLAILRNLEIPVPPIELQNLFAKIATQIEQQKQLLLAQFNQQKTLFLALQQQSFKIKV